MNTKLVVALALSPLVVWFWLLWFIWGGEFDWWRQGFFMLIALGFLGVFFWIVFTIIVSIVVLPKLDRLARPEMADMIKRTDSWWFRVMRLNGYAGALTCRRIRKVEALPIDLREQGRELRWPLYVYIYSLLSSCLLLAVLAVLLRFRP